MATASLLEQSQQGDPQAIATLMNRHLQSKGITAKVVRTGSTLKVLLESEDIPDRNQLAPFVRKGIASLKPQEINTIQVYGRRIHDNAPAWTKTFPLQLEASNPEPSADPSLASEPLLLAQTETLTSSEPATAINRLEAIELILTEAIDNDQITIRVNAEDKHLQVIAETDQFLQGPSFAEKIYKQLKDVDLAGFESVGIYKKKLKGANFFQIKSFTLDVPEAPPAPQPTPTPKNKKPTPPKVGTLNTNQKPNQKPIATSPKQANQNDPADHGTGQKPSNPKPKLDVGRVLIMVGCAVVICLVVLRTANRLLALMLLSPVLSGFSIIIGLVMLWRAWVMLKPMILTFLRQTHS